jgi:hypothetical protein
VALPAADLNRRRSHLEWMEMPLGHVLHESGEQFATLPDPHGVERGLG